MEDPGTAAVLTKARGPESHKITLYRERDIGVLSVTSYSCDLVECLLLISNNRFCVAYCNSLPFDFSFFDQKLSEVATAKFWYPV